MANARRPLPSSTCSTQSIVAPAASRATSYESGDVNVSGSSAVALPGGLGNQRDVLAIVDARELVLRGGPRLAHVTIAPPEFRGHDLHDLRALETLGMAWRIEMISEPIACDRL